MFVTCIYSSVSMLNNSMKCLLMVIYCSLRGFFARVQTSRGLSSASLLLQAAEAVLPKQKRALAVSEFKHAVVSYKRRSKHQNDEEGKLRKSLTGMPIILNMLVILFGSCLLYFFVVSILPFDHDFINCFAFLIITWTVFSWS